MVPCYMLNNVVCANILETVHEFGFLERIRSFIFFRLLHFFHVFYYWFRLQFCLLEKVPGAELDAGGTLVVLAG